MNIEPIAMVRSCFYSKFAVPRQPGLSPSAWGSLVFYPKYRSAEAIRGIDEFSHIWLIFGFHETQEQGWRPTVRPPRLGGNQRVGVFASRSTFRPNSLGLSLVKLERVVRDSPESPILLLEGLDLLDGTPIYDIKPYLPYAEALPDATAGFASEPISRLAVVVEQTAANDFDSLPSRTKAVIREALALDPRPSTCADDSERIFGAWLCGYNVRFTIGERVCRILEIAKMEISEQDF